MFNKFFKFLCGYVIIGIYGPSAERFVNICLRRSISIWNVMPVDKGIRICVSVRDFAKIPSVRRKCGVRIEILKKCGFYRLLKLYGKRYYFLIGLVLCIVFFCTATQFVWVVEINGVDNSDIESVVKTLENVGIKRGASKRNLPDSDVSKNAIINNNENIAWAWVYIEGVKARVEIYEQSLPPTVVDKSKPCDIVAACDGVIDRMVVKSGESLLNVGDAVRCGDVIVTGKVPTYKEGYPEEYIYVHSIAEVNAFTSHKKTGEYKLYYENRKSTGKKKKMISIEFFGEMISLPFSDIDYEEYDITEKRHELYIPFFGYSGITLDTVTYSEVEVEKQPVTVETAVEFAKNDLERKISEHLENSSKLLDESIEYEQIDKETISVKLEMNFIQNIAMARPISERVYEGEEIFDKQTN